MKNAVFWEVMSVALVRTDVAEEPSPSIIKVTRIGELETTLAVTSNRSTPPRNTTRAKQRNIPEDGILQLSSTSQRPDHLYRAINLLFSW
jgi:hypothetical protein